MTDITMARFVCKTTQAPRSEVETLSFILHNLPAIGERTLEHVSIVGVAVGIAILTGVPTGIAITQSQRVADTVLYLGSIVITIPSIALFGGLFCSATAERKTPVYSGYIWICPDVNAL